METRVSDLAFAFLVAWIFVVCMAAVGFALSTWWRGRRVR